MKRRITIIPNLRTIYNLLRIVNKPGAQVFGWVGDDIQIDILLVSP